MVKAQCFKFCEVNHVDSNPVLRTTNHKPTINSAVLCSDVGNEFSEVTLRGQALDTY